MASTNESDRTRDEELENLREQLMQAQKLTAMGELLSTTTHEFNNVLTTIINYAKIGMRNKDEATRDKALDKILAAGQRAARITQGILGFARNRGTGLEPTELPRIVEDAVMLLEREMVRYRISLEKHLDAVPLALANGNQIQQVLINLLVNARQAMPNGGRIIIRLSHDPASQMIELTVRDTGAGIAPDQLRKIFDRFYTTKSGPDESGKGGTGLGLAMCRDIIEAHHGRIRVESTVGRGTAFTLKLPVAVPAAAAVPQSAASPSPAPTPQV